MAFRSGFISFVGCPNVGKSTLLNALVGEKISIVSPKPQTTRNVIQGVITRDDYQMVLLDTPGIHTPQNRLGEYMMKVADTAFAEVDAIVVICDGTIGIGKRDRELLERVKQRGRVVLVINKIDAMAHDALAPMIKSMESEKWIDHIVPLSAKTGDGVAILEEILQEYLPEGPQYFPEEMMTDQPERLLIAELIREKALALLREEVPHGIGVGVDRMQEREDGVLEIFATIYCEKASHKGIIIGKNGAMLKEIGRRARKDIEHLLATRVYLEVWVKIKEDWRNRTSVIRELGYE